MNKAQEYSSLLIDELYESTPTATFDLVAKRMDLAVRIDKAIKIKGWTQKQFAEAMHKKPSEISLGSVAHIISRLIPSGRLNKYLVFNC